MKRKLFILAAGAILIAFGLGLNIQHALNDYGIADNSLHTQVLAQSSSSGDGSGTSNGTLYKMHEDDCKFTIRAAVGTKFTFYGMEFTVTSEGTMELIFEDVKTNCEGGGNFLCTPMNCAQFWRDGASGLSGVTVGSGT